MGIRWGLGGDWALGWGLGLRWGLGGGRWGFGRGLGLRGGLGWGVGVGWEGGWGCALPRPWEDPPCPFPRRAVGRRKEAAGCFLPARQRRTKRGVSCGRGADTERTQPALRGAAPPRLHAEPWRTAHASADVAPRCRTTAPSGPRAARRAVLTSRRDGRRARHVGSAEGGDWGRGGAMWGTGRERGREGPRPGGVWGRLAGPGVCWGLSMGAG